MYRKQYQNGVPSVHTSPIRQTDAGYATITYPNGTHFVAPRPVAVPVPDPDRLSTTGWGSLSTQDRVTMWTTWQEEFLFYNQELFFSKWKKKYKRNYFFVQKRLGRRIFPTKRSFLRTNVKRIRKELQKPRPSCCAGKQGKQAFLAWIKTKKKEKRKWHRQFFLEASHFVLEFQTSSCEINGLRTSLSTRSLGDLVISRLYWNQSDCVWRIPFISIFTRKEKSSEL